MTQEEIIRDVYGDGWETLNYNEQATAGLMLDWMVRNFGITGDSPTRDRKIIAAIQIACMQVFGEKYENIMCKSRKREKCDKRFMIYKIARDMSKSSNHVLSRYFPKDRVTIFNYGINQANVLLSVDQDFRTDYVRFETAVKDIFSKHYEQDNNGN